jgi:hypothetical protein
MTSSSKGAASAAPPRCQCGQPWRPSRPGEAGGFAYLPSQKVAIAVAVTFELPVAQDRRHPRPGGGPADPSGPLLGSHPRARDALEDQHS